MSGGCRQREWEKNGFHHVFGTVGWRGEVRRIHPDKAVSPVFPQQHSPQYDYTPQDPPHREVQRSAFGWMDALLTDSFASSCKRGADCHRSERLPNFQKVKGIIASIPEAEGFS